MPQGVRQLYSYKYQQLSISSPKWGVASFPRCLRPSQQLAHSMELGKPTIDNDHREQCYPGGTKAKDGPRTAELPIAYADAANIFNQWIVSSDVGCLSLPKARANCKSDVREHHQALHPESLAQGRVLAKIRSQFFYFAAWRQAYQGDTDCRSHRCHQQNPCAIREMLKFRSYRER